MVSRDAFVKVARKALKEILNISWGEGTPIMAQQMTCLARRAFNQCSENEKDAIFIHGKLPEWCDHDWINARNAERISEADPRMAALNKQTLNTRAAEIFRAAYRQEIWGVRGSSPQSYFVQKMFHRFVCKPKHFKCIRN